MSSCCSTCSPSVHGLCRQTSRSCWRLVARAYSSSLVAASIGTPAGGSWSQQITDVQTSGGDRSTKTGFRERFGCTLGFDRNAELLANGKWGSRNPWHPVASQSIKLSPVVYCDKVPTEASVLAQVAAALDHYGGDDVYKDCGVGWIVLRALELQERKNDKPSAQVTARGAESYHENHTKIFFFTVATGLILLKMKHST